MRCRRFLGDDWRRLAWMTESRASVVVMNLARFLPSAKGSGSVSQAAWV